MFVINLMAERDELNINTNWKEVLNSIENDNFEKNYKDYSFIKKEGGYYIYNKEKEIFLLKQQKEIKIYFGDNKYDTIKIISSLDIEKYMKNKNKDVRELYFKEKNSSNDKYIDKVKILGYYLRKHLNLEIREKEKLCDLKLGEPLLENQDYSPKEYSEFFSDYFIFDDTEKDKKIAYEESYLRTKINDYIMELRDNDQLKTFKFTGPSSIGKSFTLLRISRISYNIAYINLKTLVETSKDLHKIYSMIGQELKRFDIKNNLNELNEKIKNNYNDNNCFLKLLLDLMEFLNGINLNCVFIFDQFKPEYVNNNFSEKIKKLNSIKTVQCSSINDKNIRNECLYAWMNYGRNFFDYNYETQKYYFYFTKLYKYKCRKDQLNDDIFKQFSYLPKYVNKYKKSEEKNKTEFFANIKGRIEKKIDEFCKNNQIEKALLLSKLKYIIRKEYDYEIFRIIIQYCPLKYFIIVFKKNTFVIKPLFPFMTNIINYKLKKEECDEYFKKEKYKKDIIENNYVKGDYFEASVKFGLKKLKLPGINKIYPHPQTIILNEIVSMDKIKNETDLEEDYQDDDLNKENEIEDEPFYPSNNKIENDIIINNNISEDENIQNLINEDEDNYEAEVNDLVSIEEEEEEEEEENEINNEENIENDKSKIQIAFKNFENNKFESLLEEFNIEKKKNKFNEEGLSKEAISFSKTIEDYRFDEIEEQRKHFQKFEKNNFTGNESLFLDQSSKWGKALDFAYLYGKRNNKYFIGFQMKCYFENSQLSNNAIDKCWIRNNCQKILVNSMKLFNCKITKWYYYLIFYYNSEITNENISKINLDKCKKNDICYFFYEPKKKKFYNFKKKKLINMTELKVNYKANLDTFVISEEKLYDFRKMKKIKMGKNTLEMKESFIKDFSEVFKLDKNNTNIIDILSIITKNINLKNFKLLFGMKCKFDKAFFFQPDKKYILLYKKNNCQDFVASLTKKGKIEYIEVSTGNKVDNIFKVLDSTSEYYYCLYKIKKLRLNIIKNDNDNHILNKGKIPFF